MPTIAPAANLTGELDERDEVSGSVSIYRRNHSTPRIDFPMIFVGDGHLTSRLLVTATSDNPRAYRPDHRFRFPADRPEFRETSLFGQLGRLIAWLTTLGYDPGKEVLGIDVIDERRNTSFYLPKSSREDFATIRIARGDGIFLRNLQTDSDVVMHEYGHHIVYRTLKVTIGDPLAIHAALADIFPMLFHDDPCLGPTVCPKGSRACALEGLCLRSADNTLTWDDPSLGGLHLRSQVLSGLLWDLRKGGTERDTIGRIALGAVNHLKNESTVSDFVQAIKLADCQVTGCAHAERIDEIASRRRIPRSRS